MGTRPNWILTGNTYPFRSDIRAIGGKWDPDAKAWIVVPGTMRERERQGSEVARLSRKGVIVSFGGFNG